jgi:hypothetical protein
MWQTDWGTLFGITAMVSVWCACLAVMLNTPPIDPGPTSPV